MQIQFTHATATSECDVDSHEQTTLIHLADRRRTKDDRFPDVDDLLERLTDDTVNVANGRYRAR
ncbi:hypothetical protein [Yoonia litorea]|uniref:Uncharacterized protein n=1 Tax=Yoonia litorea TaxID=1123755 RepID=A0A1I6MX88_9RHOB|nr:hypothetical protein [Yoonia litorea]SFS20310.1 hypothetical protein SAMN05444714_2577 [Yoonia litorea]